MMDGVFLTQLKIIPTAAGNVLHAMKKGDAGECGFGEAYFSAVVPGAVKGWKRHRRMTLNLIVPIGEINFVLFDDRHGSPSKGKFMEERLSQQNYFRLTVPPGLWVGFQGCSKGMNIVLNIGDITHDPDELDRRDLNEITFDWSNPL
jgi:dTDP-4-dehydrorhamnose 3,5-epimerase